MENLDNKTAQEELPSVHGSETISNPNLGLDSHEIIELMVTAKTEKHESRSKRQKPEKPARWWRISKSANTTNPAPASDGKTTHNHGDLTPTPEDGTLDDPGPILLAEPIPQSVNSEEPRQPHDHGQRSIAVDHRDPLGPTHGEPCPACGFRNLPTSAYCARCGFELHLLRESERRRASTPSPQKQTPPRRRNWNIFFILLIIAGIWLFTSPVSLAGVQKLTSPIFQAVSDAGREATYFIFPAIGDPVPIKSVSASTEGFGTPATDVIGNDLKVFWSSAPLTEFGKGSSITIKFYEPVEVDRVVFSPGIQNGILAPNALGTPRDIEINLNPGSPVANSLDPSDSSSPTPTATTSSSPTPTISASPTPTISASPTPTISASPTPVLERVTHNIELGLINDKRDFTQWVDFPVVMANEIRITVNTVYPPSFDDRYRGSSTTGQVAISNISIFAKLNFLFTFFNSGTQPGVPSSPETPTETPDENNRFS